MFSEKDLRELVDYHAPTELLSIYLNTDPSLGNADSYRLRLRTMLKSVNLSADADRVEQFFATEYDWTGRSVAIFSDSEGDFFRMYQMAVPVQDLVHVGVRANVRPLAGLLDSYGGYGVVLVDKQGARLFHFHLGELREQEGVVGAAIRQSKGGGSAMTGMRGGAAVQTRVVEETVERNIRDSVEFAIQFFEEQHIRRILLSGTEENVALFRGYMPKSWQSLVVGTFSVAMTASNNEVLSRAMEVGFEAEKNREKILVERLITQAAKHSNAITGLEPTLKAVSESRIQTLVVHSGFHTVGYRCPDCQTLTSDPEFGCSNCEERAEEVEDVVSLAITTVLANGGEVEVVQDNVELKKAGAVGAFLRY
jgi:peptide subunit release factor 1 (eRF1)